MAKCKNEILVSNKNVSISEVTNDYFDVLFEICDFSVNKNAVMLNRDTVENWLGSLINTPFVAKIDGDDFTGHNVVKTIDGDYEFDTSAFGTFLDASIVKDEDDREYIQATARIWKRFAKATSIILDRIENNTLFTSWEIVVKKQSQKVIDGKIVKVIDDGVFIGHCGLGKDVLPAYETSRILNVASVDDLNKQLIQAIRDDLKELSVSTKEDDVLGNENVKKTEDGQIIDDVVENESTVAKKTNNSDSNANSVSSANDDVITSGVTSKELYEQLKDEVIGKLKVSQWDFSIIVLQPYDKIALIKMYDDDNPLSFIKFVFDVVDDKVQYVSHENITFSFSMWDINLKSEYIVDLTDTIAQLNKTVEDYKKQIVELSEYKTKVEDLEKAQIEKELELQREELAEYALLSNVITKDEVEQDTEISQMIQKLDKNGVNTIIAQRIIDKNKSTKSNDEAIFMATKVSLNTPRASISTNDNDIKTMFERYIKN